MLVTDFSLFPTIATFGTDSYGHGLDLQQAVSWVLWHQPKVPQMKLKKMGAQDDWLVKFPDSDCMSVFF